eukprot:505364-Prymnesium_polylepis.1
MAAVEAHAKPPRAGTTAFDKTENPWIPRSQQTQSASNRNGSQHQSSACPHYEEAPTLPALASSRIEPSQSLATGA